MISYHVEWVPSKALHDLEKLLNGEDNWDVEYHTFYSKFVEFGTGPAAGHGQYRPPYAPIYEWVLRKTPYSGKQAEQIAWAIQEKIFQSGTAAHPFVRPAIAEAILHIGELMDEGGIKRVAEFIMERSIDNMMKNDNIASGTMAERVYLVQGV